MNRVFLADQHAEDRAALKSLLRNVNLFVVGEAADWTTLLAEAPQSRPDMLVLDWDLLPAKPARSLADLRAACPVKVVIVLTSRNQSRRQAERSSGADSFISKSETPDRVASGLRSAAARIRA
jgi:DNA-binding NarL/FixJ family response regulator